MPSAPVVVAAQLSDAQAAAIARWPKTARVGSVGMPFGEPGAHWLRLDPEVDLRRTEYDRKAAAGRIGATAFPGAATFAEHFVLQAPAAAHMVEAYARAEIRQ